MTVDFIVLYCLLFLFILLYYFIYIEHIYIYILHSFVLNILNSISKKKKKFLLLYLANIKHEKMKSTFRLFVLKSIPNYNAISNLIRLLAC